MHVAADIGNSSIKFGHFSPPALEMLSTCRLLTHDPEFSDLAAWLPENPVNWQVASVAPAAEEKLAAWVKRNRPHDSYRLLRHSDIPIEVNLAAPERVGIDRLLAAVTANHLREPHQAAVVVDFGTAVTIDAVDRSGAFLGGAILPGPGLSGRVLHQFTAALPLVAMPEKPPAVIGKSTEAALQSGLAWGTAGAVGEIARRMTEELGGPTAIFIGGGDAPFLAQAIDPAARHTPELVLRGIALAVKDT